jgi:hypothetical protein
MRSAITLVISEEIFGLIYDGQEDFEGNFEFYFNIVLKFLVPIMVSWSQDMKAFLNLALEFFFEVSITIDEHIVKCGSYVSREGEKILFDKCDISRMITVAAITAEEESPHWILSLEDFLLFMSISNFRVLNERNVNLYSTCVFWLLDNTYARNIVYNFSN